MGWTVRDRIPVVGEIFRTCLDRPTQPSVQLVPGLSVGAKISVGVTPTSDPLMGRTACTKSHCLYKCTFYLYFYAKGTVKNRNAVEIERKCTQ